MTTLLNPYLPFGGTARAALEFYASVFGGDLEISSFGDAGFEMPEGVPGPPAENVMHGSLTTPQGFTVMASDSSDAEAGGVEGKPAIGLTGDEEATLSGWFTALSEGGVVDVPFEKAPWGDIYGQVTDRFGVRWLVNCTNA
ncbi:VOC family protein [Pseudonocardia ailaonensis]|uniref:VOC family protein n=1 Tax=Pseudonocardia ailaonensis TaxID=367279 RepID=A0ABN2NDP4_9PSEU